VKECQQGRDVERGFNEFVSNQRNILKFITFSLFFVKKYYLCILISNDNAEKRFNIYYYPRPPYCPAQMNRE
jgi:hypothetical protein